MCGQAVIYQTYEETVVTKSVGVTRGISYSLLEGCRVKFDVETNVLISRLTWGTFHQLLSGILVMTTFN